MNRSTTANQTASVWIFKPRLLGLSRFTNRQNVYGHYQTALVVTSALAVMLRFEDLLCAPVLFVYPSRHCRSHDRQIFVIGRIL